MIEVGERNIAGTWADDNKYVLLAVAVIVAAAGIAASYLVYAKKKAKAIEPVVLEQAWYYDKGVSAFMGGPGRKMFDAIAWFDKHVIDGAVNGVASVVRVSSDKGRTVQTGYVRNYALGLVAGVIVVTALILSKAVTG